MKTFNFYKLTGAGNDFILFDLKDNPNLDITPVFASNICSRHFGIGADGIILVDDSDRNDFKISFYNADGSGGVLCGNGARCSIKYASFSKRITGKKTKFDFNGLVYSGEILAEDIIRFEMKDPGEIKKEVNIFAAGHLIKAVYIDTGAPHLVININDVFKNIKNKDSFYTDINEFPTVEIGREIRHSRAFAPEGVNANFISVEGQTVQIRTYEKGVEDETLACGTGSAAVAVVAAMNYKVATPVNLITAGGETLTVNFSIDGDKISNLTLTGPAKIVFKGEITI